MSTKYKIRDQNTYDDLKKDLSANIDKINWTVYGKIAQIEKTTPAQNISYTYDAGGNRVSKLYNSNTTYYVRGAQGNTLAVYTKNGSNGIQWNEQHLYGSNRLGLWRPQPAQTNKGWEEGYKSYELSNHLGNVMAVINDNWSSENGVYEPNVLTSNDYYAFGGIMEGRSQNAGNYRYGFNGKENDNEVKGEGNQQDYGMRIYAPGIGKFLSVDPITKQYPELTPYQFASNRPIQGIDLDGLEFKSKSYYEYNVKPIIDTGTYTENVSYVNKNRPEYFILMDMIPESANAKGYDREISDRPQLYAYIEPIRPDYSAIQNMGQAGLTMNDAAEEARQWHRLKPNKMRQEPNARPTSMGTAFGGLGLFMNSFNAVGSFFGENAALNDARYDKSTFYASINLVNNFANDNNINLDTRMKGDLVNWVNSGKTPYDLESLKGLGSKERKNRNDYNKFIEKFGRTIYESRRGYNNGGSTSTRPSDKKAIPYQ